MHKKISEPERLTPVAGEYDVLVCGGGPAGFAAALRSAREGASTLLLERSLSPGGIWTAGLLPWIIDHKNKSGIMEELSSALIARGGHCSSNGKLTIPPEELKFLLEELLLNAGVKIRYGTLLTGAEVCGRRITAVYTESKSGREAWKAENYIDCTGDGDLAAFAGCRFDYGNAEGKAQPSSLIGLVGGLDPSEVKDYMGGVEAKKKFLSLMRACGVEPSYTAPSLFWYGDGLFGLMSHHGYGVDAFNADSITQAVLDGRKELHRQVNALRKSGGIWRNMVLIATSEQIGIREGRRVCGLETVTRDDLETGKERERTVCHCCFGLDVHAPDPLKCRDVNDPEIRVAGRFSIPYGALVSADSENLLMAGRCISGDFFAHASYRVTGVAVPMGEAAGYGAARAVREKIAPGEVSPVPCLDKEEK